MARGASAPPDSNTEDVVSAGASVRPSSKGARDAGRASNRRRSPARHGHAWPARHAVTNPALDVTPRHRCRLLARPRRRAHPAASGGPAGEVLGTLERHQRRPRVHSQRRSPSTKPGTYEVTPHEHGRDPARHHLRGRHDARRPAPARRRRSRSTCRRTASSSSARSPGTPTPACRARSGQGRHDGRRRRRRPRRPCARDGRPARSRTPRRTRSTTPTAPALLAGTTHDIDLVIEEKLMTVADRASSRPSGRSAARSRAGHPGQGRRHDPRST